MVRDRYVKLLLTVMAVALVAIAVALAEIALPAANATAGWAVAPGHAEPGSYGVTSASSLPLRWRVAFARNRTTPVTNCGTVVVVQNLASTDTDVQLEFFSNLGTSQHLSTIQGIPAGDQRAWWTDDNVDLDPFRMTFFNANLGVGYAGYAFVHADDPRVQATAYVACRTGPESDSTATIVSTANVPTFPVGQTLAFFQAGVPGTGPAPHLGDPDS